MRASLIVVAWNGLAYLPACLDSIVRELGPDDELIVVDNHSQDATADYVSEHYPEARVIRLPRNRGYAGGANCGLKYARGRYYFLFNQDIILGPGWLESMVAALERPGVGIVGGKLLGLDGLVQHAGGIIHWPRAIPDHFDHLRMDAGQWDVPADVGYVTGAAWGFSATTLDSVGELDEGFWPGYYEEVDFCYRVTDCGLRVRYVPSATAVHEESGSFGKHSRYYFESFHRNRLRFVLKRNSPAEFLTDFVPAERAWLQSGLGTEGLSVMSRAYKRWLLRLPAFYASAKADTSSSDFHAVAQALGDLHAIVMAARWAGQGDTAWKNS